MALSGSFTTNNLYEYSVNFSATLSWTATQNVQNNTSTINWTLTANTDGPGYKRTVYNVEITVDGTPTTSNRNTSYGDGSTIWSGSKVVTHNNDGSKTLAISARLQVGQYSYNVTGSGSWALNAIPRASEVSVSNETISFPSGSINYTITSRADFWHRVTWTLGSTTKTSDKGEINAETKTFTIGRTTLLNALPTRASGSLTITVNTYSDSGYTNLIGTKSSSATITVNTTAIKPTVLLGNLRVNTSPDANITVPVAGYSTVKGTYQVSPGTGASGTTTYFTASHGTMTTATSTTTSGTATTGTLPASTSDYTLTISAYAKDSRGAVSTTVSKTITVCGYTAPTATLAAYRTATSSSTTEDGAGLYVYVTFSGSINASINSQNAITSTACTYSGSISGTATNGAHYSLADNQNVTFNLTVTDRVTSANAVVSVASAAYPLDLYDDGQGNVGAAVGGVAPAGGFAVFVDLHLYEGQKIIIHKTGGTTEVHDVSELFN